ncbi:hypothetical protein A0H81_00636 [Grifola frondosa]|uniref:Uncharacterized protein n=1 Tax=Grifola frondosa TaxID=5627 RepID=A0A1C7MT38_GRIFR|nr:hypothetical protein A0H81_00636 [Grifola frondosa]
MPQIPRNTSFLAICSAVSAPYHESYPSLFTTYHTVLVTPCSAGVSHQPSTWLLDDTAYPYIGVGQSITCMSNPDVRLTYFDATLLALRILESDFTEFYATIFLSDNLLPLVISMVPSKKPTCHS